MADDLGVAEVSRWAAGLEEVHELIAPRFARSEPRARVAAYVRGLLAPLERKNGWTLAEDAGETSPDGMQRLLTGGGPAPGRALPSADVRNTVPMGATESEKALFGAKYWRRNRAKRYVRSDSSRSGDRRGRPAPVPRTPYP